MPEIKAFISDLDDTLLTEEHQLTDRTAQTLQRLLRQGIKVALASGRSAASMWPTVQKVGTPYPYIAYNGAQIVDSKTRKVLSSNEIPMALAKEVLAWFESRGIYCQYYEGDNWYYAKRCDISDEYGKSSGVIGTDAGMPLHQAVSSDVPKLLAVEDPRKVPALIEESRKVFGDQLIITTSKPFFIEITSPLATKGNAVRTLADMIGLSPETTICAGDSLNDLSMLRWSKLPVTVSNAREEIQSIAWRVAGDGHQDGMAILLDEIIPEVDEHAH